ncbi:MAG: phosphatase PAP2 family protein [Candidatus Paceibacterota bacterium]
MPFFYQLPKNVRACFSGKNLLLQVTAIILTYIIVISGFDWLYFTSVQGPYFHTYLFPAVIIGGLLPIFGTGALYLFSKYTKNKSLTNTSWALAQASFLGWFISSFYKAFTGRIEPDLHSGMLLDISREWNFGFLKHGIFWGWPSSHTAVAFAMAFTLIMLYPKKKTITVLVLLYAFYIGFGVSIGIHWFSEFIAGAIIGSLIGTVVGKSFRTRK